MSDGNGKAFWFWNNLGLTIKAGDKFQLERFGKGRVSHDDYLPNTEEWFNISSGFYRILENDHEISADLNGSQEISFIANGKCIQYYYVPVVTIIDALDRNRLFLPSISNNPLNPDEFSSIGKIALKNPHDIKANLFRLHGFRSAIIASDRVRQIYDRNKMRGIHFSKIT